MFYFLLYGHFIECGTRVELNWKHDFHYLKHIGHLNPGPHPSSVLPVFTVQMNRPRRASIPNEPRRRFSGSNRTEHNTQTHFTSCIHNPEFIIKSTQISSVEVQRHSLPVEYPWAYSTRLTIQIIPNALARRWETQETVNRSVSISLHAC